MNEDISGKIRIIGITGTNGKTTISYLLESIFLAEGKTSGVIGTVNHRFAGKVFRPKNTTPGRALNQQYLTDMIRENMDYCVMEVSSHGLKQGRVKGIDFHTAVFTNLTCDHLDYHGSREEYFQVKTLLFTGLPQGSAAVINADDSYGNRLQEMTSVPVITYGIMNKADITARDIQLDLSGTRFILESPQGEIPIESSLIGRHNIYNILAAAGVCLREDVSSREIQQGVRQLKVVPGRLEEIKEGQDFHVFVDYAHTDDALSNVLTSLKDISQARCVLVFGCGGDRDKDKRTKMGRIASELADFSILTNDNPRSEEPREIIDQIIAGFSNGNFKVILDRRQAIQEGLNRAGEGNVVLIAGKGHEDRQIFKDRIVEFNEREVVRECLQSQRLSASQKAN